MMIQIIKNRIRRLICEKIQICDNRKRHTGVGVIPIDFIRCRQIILSEMRHNCKHNGQNTLISNMTTVDKIFISVIIYCYIICKRRLLLYGNTD